MSGTIAKLRIDLERAGGFSFRSGAVLILDEVSMANTREVSAVMAAAERSGVKVIAIGDSGQLPSIEAGGWLASISHRLAGQRLTEVMRQRDVVERRLLARVHGGSPVAYIRHKQEVGELRVHESAEAGEAALVEQWAEQEAKLGRGGGVMIARDNTRRTRLNEAAREHLRGLGEIGEDVDVGGRSFAIGDRVIARRNDRLIDVDNGTRVTVRAISASRAELVLETDASGLRTLGRAYVANNLEHAYALTAHGLQGATVEWAGVIGEPSDFTRNWSYTALSRAREPTQLHLVEPEVIDAEREDAAPGTRPEVREDALSRLSRRMRVRDDEDLAVDQLPEGSRSIEPAEIHVQEAVAHLHDSASSIPARVGALFAELGEIDARLASLPVTEAKLFDRARRRAEHAAHEIIKGRKRLGGGLCSGDAPIERRRIEQAERDLGRGRAKERELSLVVDSSAGWKEEADRLTARHTALGREIAVARWDMWRRR